MSTIKFKYIDRLTGVSPVNSPISNGDTVDQALNKLQGQAGTNSTVQKLEIAKATILQGSRKRLNFIDGANVTIVVADDNVNDKVNITISAASGSSGNSGQAVLDFSVLPLDNIARFSVTGQAWVTATSIIRATLRPLATASHSEDEHLMMNSFISINIPRSSLIVGGGFDIVAICHDNSILTGTFNVDWWGT